MVVRESDDGDPAFSSAVSWFETRLNATMLRQGGGIKKVRLSGQRCEPCLSDLQRPRKNSQWPGGLVSPLATGEERSFPRNSGGTLLGEDGGDSTNPSDGPAGYVIGLQGYMDAKQACGYTPCTWEAPSPASWTLPSASSYPGAFADFRSWSKREWSPLNDGAGPSASSEERSRRRACRGGHGSNIYEPYESREIARI